MEKTTRCAAASLGRLPMLCRSPRLSTACRLAKRSSKGTLPGRTGKNRNQRRFYFDDYR